MALLHLDDDIILLSFLQIWFINIIRMCPCPAAQETTAVYSLGGPGDSILNYIPNSEGSGDENYYILKVVQKRGLPCQVVDLFSGDEVEMRQRWSIERGPRIKVEKRNIVLL